MAADPTEMAARIGLQGQEAVEFIREQQRIEREERQARRQHELELARLNIQNGRNLNENERLHGKAPKLPPFVDGKDDLDSYLQRFERFARTSNWHERHWATNLSALLSGRALDVYSRLSEETANDYESLKQALFKRYNLTEEGYRKKFRQCKPEGSESPEQYLFRIKSYLERWIELSSSESTFDGLRDLFLKEHFINTCPKDLGIFLHERAPQDLNELTKLADQYLLAHGKTLRSNSTEIRPVTVDNTKNNESQSKCYNCNTPGHHARNCTKPKSNQQRNNDSNWRSNRKCTYCNRFGHTVQECRTKTANKTASCDIQEETADDEPQIEVSVGLQPTSIPEQTTNIQDCIQGNKLLLANGEHVDIVTNVITERNSKRNMPVIMGNIGNHTVTALRDTGCSGIVVKRKFVEENQLTGKYGYMTMVDNTIRRAPIGKIIVDTPYLRGEVEALCLPDVIYDLIIGNVPGARAPDDPDTAWQAAAATNKSEDSNPSSEQKYSVENLSDKILTSVTRERLIELQKDDDSLTNLIVKNPNQFNLKDNVLQRTVKDHNDEEITQIVVPKVLRRNLLSLSHDTKMSGHLGYKKSYDRLRRCFYWPGMTKDVREYCKTCDVCQKTTPKGRTPVAPLGTMPIVGVAFEQVAVDLIGPFSPRTTEGHRYVLTVVDYATRYPEAIPLREATTDAVAEALISIFSRVGMPSKLISDQGSQFTSECMQKVCDLLNINHAVTTPYHPMANGLVESFNGCLKTMIKRVCTDYPTEWHKCIDPLLFSYREVPQEATGFAPFELIYGRNVRGPLSIVKALWTDNPNEEIRTAYDYVFELREKLQNTMDIAQQNMSEAQKRNKRYYDRRAKDQNIRIGDYVLLLLPTKTNKLMMQWKGPYKVEAKLYENNYRIRINKKLRTYHVNMLKRYHHRKDDNINKTNTNGDNYPQAASAMIELETEQPDQNDEPEIHVIETSETIPNVDDITIGMKTTPEEKKQIMAIINEYRQVFNDQPGYTEVVNHSIKLIDETPVRSKPYPLPFSERDKLKKEIEKIMEEKIIRRSTSAYASPVVVVRKKDGSLRICIDYRKLNKNTIFDPEPMITTEDLLQKLSKAKYFSKLDMSKGFWQVAMNEEDIEKTAFVTPDGHYEFLRMPFGLMNASATLVRCMRKVLHGLENVDTYVDDVIIHSENWKEHIKTLRMVLKRLKDANITIKPSKCTFGVKTIEFIGHTIENGEVKPNGSNISKIQNASPPTTKKQVQSFLGLTGYYREYIPQYSSIAAPLTDLTKKGLPNKIKWTTKENEAFETLQNALIATPILKLANVTRPFTLRTDASDVGVGAVLLQEHHGQLFPTSYASKKLLDREKNYSISEKECLAIVWAVKKFQNYLYNTIFTLQTDHECLKYLEANKFNNARLMRWAMTLQAYKMNVEVIKGTSNFGADYLSRQ